MIWQRANNHPYSGLLTCTLNSNYSIPLIISQAPTSVVSLHIVFSAYSLTHSNSYLANFHYRFRIRKKPKEIVQSTRQAFAML